MYQVFLVCAGLAHRNQDESIVRAMLPTDVSSAEADAINFGGTLSPQMKRSLGAAGFEAHWVIGFL